MFATSMIAGIYLVLTAALAIWFGSLVDHNRKKAVFIGSSIASLALYGLSLAAYMAVSPKALDDISNIALWLFVMLGVIAGNLRNIALPTLVTFMIPVDRRDKANGLVGMVTGIGFARSGSGHITLW